MDKFKANKEYPQLESEYYLQLMRISLASTLSYAKIFIKLLNKQVSQLRKY